MRGLLDVRNKIYKNVDVDHVGIKKDGLPNESGPFNLSRPQGYRGPYLVDSKGKLVTDSRDSRGSKIVDTDMITVTTAKSGTTNVVGFQEQSVATPTPTNMGGKTGVVITFYDAATELVYNPNTKTLRYVRNYISFQSSFKVQMENELNNVMRDHAGRKMIRLDDYTSDDYSAFENQPSFEKITTDRILPHEMIFANVGGPLYGQANLGWNSIFFFMFKINNRYDGVVDNRWIEPRNKYWMLRGAYTVSQRTVKIKAVSQGSNGPEIVDRDIISNDVLDTTDPNMNFPRNTFEVSWLGDGLPAELDPRTTVKDHNNQDMNNPDYMYKNQSGRMPVWRNLDNPVTSRDNSIAMKNESESKMSQYADRNAFATYWNTRIQAAEKSVDEKDKWDPYVDHKKLWFSVDGGIPRGARCIWRELTNGVYTMRFDALHSGYCSFDLTRPNSYIVGRSEGSHFIKPQKSNGGWINEYSHEIDLRVLDKVGTNAEYSIFVRPRVLKFTATTIYMVMYLIITWDGFPIFGIDPAWMETLAPKYILPFTNSGGHSYNQNAASALAFYKDQNVPVPFDSQLFTWAHGGFPLIWLPLWSTYSLTAMAHPKNVFGTEVAVIRKHDSSGKSDLYCVYNMDGESVDNPLNRDELMFSGIQ